MSDAGLHLHGPLDVTFLLFGECLVLGGLVYLHL
jgi:hypothetical protein